MLAHIYSIYSPLSLLSKKKRKTSTFQADAPPLPLGRIIQLQRRVLENDKEGGPGFPPASPAWRGYSR